MARTPRAVSNLSKNLKLTSGGVIVPSNYQKATGFGAGRYRQFTGFDYDAERHISLPISIAPARALEGSMDLSIAVQEMRQWSIEVATAIATVAQDIFTSSDGATRSWQAVGVRETPYSKKRLPLNEDSAAVIRDLQERRSGKDLVCGGTRFQRAAAEMLVYGDSFVKIRFDREGIGSSHTDYCVAETRYLYPLRTSVLLDEDTDKEMGYLHERIEAITHSLSGSGETDEYFRPIEVLQFRSNPQSHYGTSAIACMMPHWEALKKALPALVSAMLSIGTSPWIHEFPKEWPEQKKDQYIENNESSRKRSVVKHLYLDHDADVRRAANNNSGLEELIEAWLELRRSMIPMGLPNHYFSLPHRASTANVSQQPAMSTARKMAAWRSDVGDQIKWLCDIEIALKLGFDDRKCHPFEIVWPEWKIMPPQEVEVHKDRDQVESGEQSEGGGAIASQAMSPVDREFQDKVLFEAVRQSMAQDV